MSWEQVKLGDIFEIARGGSPRPIDQYITDDPNGLNWISIKDASNSSKYIYKTEKKIKPEGLHKTRLVHPNDFLLTNSMSFGRPYIMKTTGCIHDGWLVLSADKTKVDTDYFYHLLGSDFMYRKFTGLAAGAVVKNLNTELVKSVSVPLPPLSEQRRIASILDQADELRQKRQQAIEKLDQLLQATFIDMFGDPVSNPKGWEKDELQNICKQVIDCPHSTPTWSDKGIICLRTSNLGKGEWIWDDTRYVSSEEYKERTKRSEIFEGDIILSREGTVGIAAIVPNNLKLSLGQRLVQLTPRLDRINSEFLLQVLLYDLDPIRISSLMVGSTSKHINVKDLRALKVFVPPLELQRKFSLIALQISQQKIELKSSLSNVDNLFKSLQNQAFNGTL